MHCHCFQANTRGLWVLAVVNPGVKLIIIGHEAFCRSASTSQAPRFRALFFHLGLASHNVSTKKSWIGLGLDFISLCHENPCCDHDDLSFSLCKSFLARIRWGRRICWHWITTSRKKINCTGVCMRDKQTKTQSLIYVALTLSRNGWNGIGRVCWGASCRQC